MHKNKELSYLKYCDINNLYVWTMSQKLLVNKFEWIEETPQFNEDFLKNYYEESDERYFLEVDVQYEEKLHEPHNDLPFLPEINKILKKGKLVTNLYDKKYLCHYVIHIKNLKKALDHGLILKNVYRVINFNQKDWLKPFNNMNTKLRQKQKIILRKTFLR